MMRGRWVLLLALVWLQAGCCAYPGVFDKVHRSLTTVQQFYEPLVQDAGYQDDRVRRALIAADTTLLLAGELQRQWCPDPRQASQLELQTQEATKLAQEAGVADARSVPEAIPPKEGE